MKHETGSAEFLSSTLDSAHGDVAIFPEYLTTGPRYLDLPPRQGENQTKMLNLQKYYDSGILSSSCMRGFVILFWQEIKTCSSSPSDIDFLHPMEVCRTAKNYMDCEYRKSLLFNFTENVKFLITPKSTATKLVF